MPLGHTTPRWPQLFGSVWVSVGCPLQIVWPPALHWLLTQVWPTGQVVLHWPLAASHVSQGPHAFGVQAPFWQVVQAGQLPKQTPEEQVWHPLQVEVHCPCLQIWHRVTAQVDRHAPSTQVSQSAALHPSTH